MTLLDRVCRLLDDTHVAHALIGAAALAVRGVARSTYDIDLLVSDPRVLEPALWDVLRASRASIDIRKGDADDPLGGVVRVEAPPERPVDVILGRHAWHARAVERAERPPDGPPVVITRDLILLKLYAGGVQDLWDVRELLQLPDAERVAAEVTTELADRSESMRFLWAEARR